MDDGIGLLTTRTPVGNPKFELEALKTDLHQAGPGGQKVGEEGKDGGPDRWGVFRHGGASHRRKNRRQGRPSTQIVRQPFRQPIN